MGFLTGMVIALLLILHQGEFAFVSSKRYGAGTESVDPPHYSRSSFRKTVWNRVGRLNIVFLFRWTFTLIRINNVCAYRANCVSLPPILLVGLSTSGT